MVKEDLLEKFKPYKRNITLSYIIGSLMWGRFFIPVLALFYIASQVPLEQFAIIMAVFSLTTLLLEIPTGVLADLLGKKKTLLISRFMYIIEIAILAFSNGFWPFLIAKIISGIGVSLSSGTSSALMFDSLKKFGKTKDHKRISGNLISISNVSMAFVFIIGAYLFTINPKLPAYFSLPFILLGFVLTFFLKEPYLPRKSLSLSNSFKHLKQGLRFFMLNSNLKYLATLTLFVGSAISMMLSFSSAYFSRILIPISLIGLISFFAALLTAFSSKKAHKFENRLGEKKSLILIQVMIVFSVLFMALVIPYFGVLFYFLIPLTQGFSEVIIGDYVNRHVKSSHRSTMLSINNMFDNIGITILFPLLGYLNKSYSMTFALSSLGLFLALSFLLSSFYFLKILKKK